MTKPTDNCVWVVEMNHQDFGWIVDSAFSMQEGAELQCAKMNAYCRGIEFRIRRYIPEAGNEK